MRQKTIQLYQGPLFKQHGLQVCACYRMLYVCRSLVLNGLSCVLGESPEKNRNRGTSGQVASPILRFFFLPTALPPSSGHPIDSTTMAAEGFHSL